MVASGQLFMRRNQIPRQARLDAPETLHHVIIRGIEKCIILKPALSSSRPSVSKRYKSIICEERVCSPLDNWGFSTSQLKRQDQRALRTWLPAGSIISKNTRLGTRQRLMNRGYHRSRSCISDSGVSEVKVCNGLISGSPLCSGSCFFIFIFIYFKKNDMVFH